MIETEGCVNCGRRLQLLHTDLNGDVAVKCQCGISTLHHVKVQDALHEWDVINRHVEMPSIPYWIWVLVVASWLGFAYWIVS